MSAAGVFPGWETEQERKAEGREGTQACYLPSACGDGAPNAQLCGRAVGNAKEGLSVFLRKYQLYNKIPTVRRKEYTGEGEEVVFTEHLLYASTGSHTCGALRIQELRGPSLG